MKEISHPIRIVVPAYKAEKTIIACIDAIFNAVYRFTNWELVVVDNGFNPNLEKLLKQLPIRIVHKSEYASAAYARNIGTEEFHEGILIFIDSDVIVQKECLNRLIRPIIDNEATASIGNYSKDVAGLNFAQSYKQLYIHHIYDQKNNFIQNDFWTAISAIKAKTFHKLKGFNINYKGANGEDQEFGIRLTKNEFKTINIPTAQGKHINPYTLRKIVQNDYRKGMTAMSNSLKNQVPLHNNRHAKRGSILAVAFASLIPVSIIISMFYKPFLVVSIFLSILWFIFRFNLIKCFFKAKGPIFLFKSISFILVLDLVRFICVISGYINHWLIRQTTLNPNFSHE